MKCAQSEVLRNGKLLCSQALLPRGFRNKIGNIILRSSASKCFRNCSLRVAVKLVSNHNKARECGATLSGPSEVLLCDFVCFLCCPISLPITLYRFLFPQHFLRCRINFFNAGDLIAKAHINSLEGVRKNSRVTQGNSNRAGIQSECICCATQPHYQGVKWCVLKLSEKMSATRNICFILKIQRKISR